MSLPIELFPGYGLLAIVCERWGAAGPAWNGGACPDCGKELEDASWNDLEDDKDT